MPKRNLLRKQRNKKRSNSSQRNLKKKRIMTVIRSTAEIQRMKVRVSCTKWQLTMFFKSLSQQAKTNKSLQLKRLRRTKRRTANRKTKACKKRPTVMKRFQVCQQNLEVVHSANLKMTSLIELFTTSRGHWKKTATDVERHGSKCRILIRVGFRACKRGWARPLLVDAYCLQLLSIY